MDSVASECMNEIKKGRDPLNLGKIDIMTGNKPRPSSGDPSLGNLMYAHVLLEEAGLDMSYPNGWTLDVRDFRSKWGVCRYKTKTIALASFLVDELSKSEIRETVLHEAAHALVGFQHKHDAVWKAMARKLGLQNPRRGSKKTRRIPFRMKATCKSKHGVHYCNGLLKRHCVLCPPGETVWDYTVLKNE